MLKVKEVEAMLADLLTRQQKDRTAEGKISLKKQLVAANEFLGAENPEELPDEAYNAGARIVREEICAVAAVATRNMIKLFDVIHQLPEVPTPAQLKKLQAAFEDAQHDYLFTALVAKNALLDVDYSYLAEVAIEASDTENDTEE